MRPASARSAMLDAVPTRVSCSATLPQRMSAAGVSAAKPLAIKRAMLKRSWRVVISRTKVEPRRDTASQRTARCFLSGYS